MTELEKEVLEFIRKNRPDTVDLINGFGFSIVLLISALEKSGKITRKHSGLRAWYEVQP